MIMNRKLKTKSKPSNQVLLEISYGATLKDKHRVCSKGRRSKKLSHTNTYLLFSLQLTLFQRKRMYYIWKYVLFTMFQGDR